MSQDKKFTITSDCINCGACVPECPVDAIVEKDGQHIINEACTGCEACVPACPVDAIVEAK